MNIREWSKNLINHPLFKIFLAGVLVWLVYKVRFVLAAVFLSYIVAVSLLPIKKYLVKRKVPEILASLIPYLVLIGIFVVIGYLVLPTIISQFRLLLENFPTYASEAGRFIGEGAVREYLENAARSLVGNLGESLIPVTREAVKIATYVIAGFILSIYVLFSHNDLKRWFVKRVDNSTKTFFVLDQIEDGLGRWMRGQIAVAFIVGVLTWVVLLIVGIDFALTLAIITGLLEFVPYVGPIIAAVPAIAVGFSYSPSTALTVALVFALIQLLENNLVVPSVMKYSVKLNPGIVILLILIGGELFGVIGAILAVPVATVVKITFQNI